MPLTDVEYQIMLLPARTAAEAAAWGGAALEYAAAFPGVQFARDPERVDWRSYRWVTVVRPAFWPDDLPVLIKQANPRLMIDRVPVDTPEALRLLLNVRVYYGWRYGPQTGYDWAHLWPPGKTLIGLHGRSSGELEEADYAIISRARIEAVKLTSHATMRSVERLRAIDPNMFIMVRPMVSFMQADQPRRVTPQEFYDWTAPTVARLYDHDPAIRYIELHNEPNMAREGCGASWQDGAEFGDWFLELLELYRQSFPDARLGFPGLSPGGDLAAVGRVDDMLFLEQALPAAQQADWIGLHSYWINERELTDRRLGFNFERYRQLFPEKVLFITEFGNPAQSKVEVARQYLRYYGMLRGVPGLGAAFAYVVSTPDQAESASMAWRDEYGRDVGIADVLGARKFD